MRTLLLTDLHLYEKPSGHLDAQVEAVHNILASHPDITDIVILGDVFMRRKPSPSELLAFQSICDNINLLQKPTVVIRGNHDSEDKSDNGKTVLTLYRSEYIQVVTQVEDHWPHSMRVFIPHYEDESKIVEALAKVPSNFEVFGHFGYNGCMNSIGDLDFGIDLEHFKNQTYLGHIHQYKEEGNVTILGTPWSTNFGEAGKWKGYHILEDGKLESFETKSGPRHIITNLSQLQNPDYVEVFSRPDWYTILRVMLEPGEGMQDVPKDLNVAHIDYKYSPTFDEDTQSSWRPDADLFQLNSQIIEDYVAGCVTSLDSSSIMEGYQLIKSGAELPDED